MCVCVCVCVCVYLCVYDIESKILVVMIPFSVFTLHNWKFSDKQTNTSTRRACWVNTSHLAFADRHNSQYLFESYFTITLTQLNNLAQAFPRLSPTHPSHARRNTDQVVCENVYAAVLSCTALMMRNELKTHAEPLLSLLFQVWGKRPSDATPTNLDLKQSITL